MKKHKRKALRKAFTAVFSLTLIALALVAYGLLCWRAGQYKNNLEGRRVGNANPDSVAACQAPRAIVLSGEGHGTYTPRGAHIGDNTAGSNPAPSNPLPQRPEKVEGQDLSSGGKCMPSEPLNTGLAPDDTKAPLNHPLGVRQPTQFTSKPKKKHPTTASGARSNPMPFYPWKVSPKQSVWLYRDQDRSKE